MSGLAICRSDVDQVVLAAHWKMARLRLNLTNQRHDPKEIRLDKKDTDEFALFVKPGCSSKESWVRDGAAARDRRAGQEKKPGHNHCHTGRT